MVFILERGSPKINYLDLKNCRHEEAKKIINEYLPSDLSHLFSLEQYIFRFKVSMSQPDLVHESYPL